MKSDYEKIINRFEEHEFYTKQEVIDGLHEIGLLKNKNGLIGKLLNRINEKTALTKEYSNGHNQAQFFYNKRNDSYQMRIFNSY